MTEPPSRDEEEDALVDPATAAERRRFRASVREMEERVVRHHDEHRARRGLPPLPRERVVAAVLRRNPRVGLGVTVRETTRGRVRVSALVRQDGTRCLDASRSDARNPHAGPAEAAGVRPGDRVLGLRGEAFLSEDASSETEDGARDDADVAEEDAPESSSETNRLEEDLLRTAAHAMLHAFDPVVLHLYREDDKGKEKYKDTTRPPPSSSSSSLEKGESTVPPSQTEPTSSYNAPPSSRSRPAPAVHPFAKALTRRGLLNSPSDESIVTMQINSYNNRTRHWEETCFFHVDRKNPNRFLPINPAATSSLLRHGQQFSHKLFTPSTPAETASAALAAVKSIVTNFPGARKPNNPSSSHVPHPHHDPRNSLYIPLSGVRTDLCVRIVNSFIGDGDRPAYTVWVHDVVLGREWYAPVRYRRDFRDLRRETSRLLPEAAALPFPEESRGGWGLLGRSSSVPSDASRLEAFLRGLAALPYRATPHRRLAEAAVHLQSFLGCDAVGADDDDEAVVVAGSRHVAANASRFVRRERSSCRHTDRRTTGLSLLLKRAAQRCARRALSLPATERLVERFVEERAREGGTTPHGAADEDTPARVREARDLARRDLERARDFLDSTQDLLLDGLGDDLRALLRRPDYAPLADRFADRDAADEFFSECVREQVEIEVYVPLRSALSRRLVDGWRHDDLEMRYKMRELRRRPRSFFRLRVDSPSDWRSATRMLRVGVGLSTLPCEKLQAVVDAAKEIARLFAEEHRDDDDGGVGASVSLGADDFLPVFIYCVVRAELERPCALCVLLRTLCEPSKRIGETGYYLASFEAAIAHIGDMDLTDVYDGERDRKDPPLL